MTKKLLGTWSPVDLAKARNFLKKKRTAPLPTESDLAALEEEAVKAFRKEETEDAHRYGR